jgi:hypothetical protein
MLKARESIQEPNFIDSIEHVVGALWSCDSETATAKKARDIRRHLAQATDQLPSGQPGHIHVGLETLDGYPVEEERYRRITDTVFGSDARGKDLRWIYTHLFEPTVPPDANWDFGESAYWFGRKGDQPLADPLLVSPPGSGVDGSVHWRPS